ncbi:hypothetical protein G5C66_14360 [Nocardioides sp. KC13]|uniref:Phosphodiesterase n=1 Tax=Nocardioides turkmenicus TaxID=2711220 RepID=A0A6M1R2G2_9ACTN|nr:hypothetical protein [Nocardioides sp. KC13]NGN93922.1 hypothetical protein [Nocardioides sp. KC13]
MNPVDVVGRVLQTAVGVLAHLRPADKPLHPHGTVHLAVLRRHPGATTGAAFLDEGGTDEVVVRLSRATGLPEPVPDVNGLALRVPTIRGEHADLLLATTGQGRWTRFLLAPRTGLPDGFFSTLLPYRTPTGPVWVGAQLVEGTWQLMWARAGTDWTSFATLELTVESGRDLLLSFDPTRATPPGLEIYEWHRRVRAPAYATARKSRTLGVRPLRGPEHPRDE